MNADVNRDNMNQIECKRGKLIKGRDVSIPIEGPLHIVVYGKMTSQEPFFSL